MSSADRDKLLRTVDNEILKDQFIQELGQKAIVKRTSVDQSEHTDQLRAVLSDIARDLQSIGQVPKGMQYRGSLSVHIFTSEILREGAFITLNNLEDLPLPLADAALRELNGSTKENYSKRRSKQRSGF